MNAITPAPIVWRYTYRAQLDRVRRVRAHFDDRHASLTEAEDLMWSFFQHCWHVRDWLFADDHWKPADRNARVALVASIKADIKHSDLLQTCAGIANATKHLEHRENQAQPHHMNANLGGGPRMEMIVRGIQGEMWRGHVLADACIGEWERILKSRQLSIEPMPAN